MKKDRKNIILQSGSNQLKFGRFVEDSLAVAVEHHDVTDHRGHREQGKPSTKIQQGWYDAELSSRSVHIHDKRQAISLDQCSSVLVKVIGVAEV